MFSLDQERVRSIYSRLTGRQSLNLPFEERFEVIRLHYPLEELKAGGQACPPGEYLYCLFANARGIRELQINERQAAVALKIKAQLPLNLEEKAEALHMLRALSR